MGDRGSEKSVDDRFRKLEKSHFCHFLKFEIWDLVFVIRFRLLLVYGFDILKEVGLERTWKYKSNHCPLSEGGCEGSGRLGTLAPDLPYEILWALEPSWCNKTIIFFRSGSIHACYRSRIISDRENRDAKNPKFEKFEKIAFFAFWASEDWHQETIMGRPHPLLVWIFNSVRKMGLKHTWKHSWNPLESGWFGLVRGVMSLLRASQSLKITIDSALSRARLYSKTIISLPVEANSCPLLAGSFWVLRIWGAKNRKNPENPGFGDAKTPKIAKNEKNRNLGHFGGHFWPKKVPKSQFLGLREKKNYFFGVDSNTFLHFCAQKKLKNSVFGPKMAKIDTFWSLWGLISPLFHRENH